MNALLIPKRYLLGLYLINHWIQTTSFLSTCLFAYLPLSACLSASMSLSLSLSLFLSNFLAIITTILSIDKSITKWLDSTSIILILKQMCTCLWSAIEVLQWFEVANWGKVGYKVLYQGLKLEIQLYGLKLEIQLYGLNYNMCYWLVASYWNHTITSWMHKSH